MREAIGLFLSTKPKLDPNNNPNPVHVSLARQGYRLQSAWLRIPDRYGFFSPGPVQAQEFQGRVLADALASYLLFESLMAALVVILVAILDPAKAGFNPLLLGSGVLTALSIPCWLQHWVLAFAECRRAVCEAEVRHRKGKRRLRST